MTPEEFQKFYPVLLGWIDVTLKGSRRKHSNRRLARGFHACRYISALTHWHRQKVVLVDKLPIPPLSSWGLTRFADFERGNFDGITLRNEAIHFHELIHVVQWRILGPEQFLRSYADGLERFGYGDSPLEVMAYDAEAAFTAKDIFGAEKMVAQKLS
jgi:hypothetical protein